MCKVYDRFTDRLPDFSCLGIKKLLIASKLPEHVKYVEANLERLTETNSDRILKRKLKQLLGSANKKHPARLRPPRKLTWAVTKSLHRRTAAE